MTGSAHEDKLVERRRYDARAVHPANLVGLESVPIELRAPYHAYERALLGHLAPGMSVLEIGSGTGEFTATLVRSGVDVFASDISAPSLLALRRRFEASIQLVVVAADMERLPFRDVSFDVVASAGSLSYGDPALVLTEVHRVLRPGGSFICVDSLNHNPAYRLNRWIHYLRGNRSRSTLLRMPTLRTIDSYREVFGTAAVEYFGAISWLMPMLRRLLGARLAAALSEKVDGILGVRTSAFKFVMTATKCVR